MRPAPVAISPSLRKSLQRPGDDLAHRPDAVRELLLGDGRDPPAVGLAVVGERQEVARHALPDRAEGLIRNGRVDVLEAPAQVGQHGPSDDHLRLDEPDE